MNDTPRRSSRREPEYAAVFGFGPVNYALMGAAVLAIVLGYVLLGRGSVTAAPLLLVLGYVVLIPAALLAGYRRIRDDD